MKKMFPKEKRGKDGKWTIFFVLVLSFYLINSHVSGSTIVREKIFPHNKALTLAKKSTISQRETRSKGNVLHGKSKKHIQSTTAGTDKLKKAATTSQNKALNKSNKDTEKYIFTAVGKNDPFVPFFDTKGSQPRGISPLVISPGNTELERIKLSDLTLVSIVKEKNKTLAMVEGPDGKGYMLKKGVGIGKGGGKVEKIIWESKMTPLGEKIIKKVVIKEPVIEPDGKIGYRFIDMELGKKPGDEQ